MAQIETWFAQDINNAVKVHYIDGNVFSQDNEGNVVGVRVFDGTDPVTLSGTISANVIRGDGATVAVSGTASGNEASVVLPQAAYAVPGLISIIIKETDDEQVTTLCCAVANVYESTTSTTVDPGTIIPSVQALIEDIETAVASIPADYSDLWETLAPPFSTSAAYSVGQYVTYDGGLYKFTSPHAAGSWSSGDVVAANIGNDLSNVLSAIDAMPEQKDSTENDVDLDIADEDGNVILRLEGGHIKTKEFDSSDLDDLFDAKQDVLTFDEEPTEDSDNPVTSGGVYEALQSVTVEQDVEVKGEDNDVGQDLDIVDENANAIARFSDGGIIVKQFDGRKYTTYSVPGTFNRSELTLTVDRQFKKGQKIVLHIERGAKPWEYGAFVSYYEGSKLISSAQNRDSAYIEHIITADCNSISAVYASTAFSRDGVEVLFEISLLGDVPIRPTVVTIKQDGTGDYLNIHDCLEAIGLSANDVLNPYRIEIYPGTYDVFDDYTDEEIENIHDDDDPTSPPVQEGFVGPKLLNGMSLVGIGDPSEIVLNGYLDTTTWAKKYRDQISTLNLQGTSSIENLTVLATNLRYCVHDDWQFNGAKHLRRLVKNCIFRGYNIAYRPYTTYGAGCPISAGYFEFIDCDFGENAGLHASALQNSRLQCRLVHCKGHGFRIGDSSIDEQTQPGKSVYTFIDCDFGWIWASTPDTSSHAIVMGCCGRSPLYDLPLDMLYNTGDVVIDPRTDLSVGEVVEWYADTEHGFKWKTATSVDKAKGVVVFESTTDAYIQTTGYVRTDRVGLTSFSLNDYITVTNGAFAVTQNASDAVGRIEFLNENGDGFIKLNWR